MARTRRGGFTLVEVLATLVLIGIVLPVAMQGISLALRAGGTAKRSVEAASLAEAKLSELMATGEWELNLLSGDFGQEWPDYRWQAEVFQRGDVTTVSELTVTVIYNQRGRETGVTVSTLIYLPPDPQTTGTGATGGGG